MAEQDPASLHLTGYLQLKTAQQAIEYTGRNPMANKLITACLQVDSFGDLQEDRRNATLYISGGDTAEIRTDLIASLETMSQSHDFTPERRVAALALHELLTRSAEK